MRVQIEHVPKTEGWMSKKKYIEVHTTVQFNEEELSIIDGYDLKDLVVLEREPSLTARKVEDFDESHYWLRLRHLLNGKADIYTVVAPVPAKRYQERLEKALAEVKTYLDETAEPLEPKAFEL